jgi:TonB family protein
MAKSVDDRAEAGARRDEGAYCRYVTEEQQSQPGWIGREGDRLSHSRALGLAGVKRRGVGWLVGVTCLLATASAIAGEVVKPRLLDSVEASYPEGAHGAATVELSVLIGEDGRVTEVDVRSGDAPFDAAARAAVARWVFSPAMRDNVPVKSRVSVKVSFVEPVAAPPANVNVNVIIWAITSCTKPCSTCSSTGWTCAGIISPRPHAPGSRSRWAPTSG